MKNMRQTGKQNHTQRQNVRYNLNKHRPEIRDDLDSRENEEQIFKGDDVTHNQKVHSNKEKKHK
jgi:DNA polymerase III delta prime subunit